MRKVRLPASDAHCLSEAVGLSDQQFKQQVLTNELFPGIDVQAELRLKTGNPGGGPAKQNILPPKPPSALECAAVNLNSAQRHPPAGIAPKSDQFGMAQHREGAYGIPSPQFQATPQSHVSSPSNTKSPGFPFQAAISPVGMDPQGQHGRPQLLPQPRSFTQASKAMKVPQSNLNEPKSNLPGSTAPLASRAASAFYPSPFQKHYDQLGKLAHSLLPYRLSTLWCFAASDQG